MKILVGVDGSEGGAAALRWATRLAMTTGDEIVVVHAVEPPEYDVRPLGLPRAVLNEANWREALLAEVEGVWCEPLSAAGLAHRVRIAEGRAGPCLIDLAVQEHAGLVVTGRSHVTGLAELVHGSVNSHVAHHAPCPTVVVPAERRAA